MTEEQKKKMEELVADLLRTEYLNEEGDEFHGEIYADYRDEISGREAGEIIDSEHPWTEFWERIARWYQDCEWEYKDELIITVKRRLAENDTSFPDGLGEDEKEFVEEFIRDRVWYDYPEDHYLNQKMYVNIMIDTGDCNYDFALNSVYPCWYGRAEDRIDNKAGIVWLAKTQG